MVLIQASSLQSLNTDAPEGGALQAIPTQNFAVGQFEITKDQFSFFASATNYEIEDDCYIYRDASWDDVTNISWKHPGYSQTGNHPVTCVNINDAIAYVRWISTKTGQKYHLLSEAEWAYMAEIDTKTDYSFGNDLSIICQYGNGADQASDFKWSNPNCNDGFGFKSAPVGSFLANKHKIYDTIG